MKKIYFAGSIRGGREDAAIYAQLIAHIQTQATVLTEHISDANLTADGEGTLSDPEIYARDMGWLRSCDAVIAEVTHPSLGVGYELGQAEAEGIPVLCLFNTSSGRRLSAMLSGNPRLRVQNYADLDEAQTAINNFLSTPA